MKYLKKFNEGYVSNKIPKKLRNDFNDIFLDIIDNGFDIEITTKYFGKSVTYTFDIDKGVTDDGFILFEIDECMDSINHLLNYFKLDINPHVIISLNWSTEESHHSVRYNSIDEIPSSYIIDGVEVTKVSNIILKITTEK